MDAWRGTVTMGEYSVVATVHCPRPEVGKVVAWYGVGTVQDAWLLERLMTDAGKRLETNIGTIIINHVSPDGSFEFQGSSTPRGPLASEIGVGE